MQAPNLSGVFDSLTRQERTILTFIADGLTSQDIANELFIATCTVKKHREHIFEKANVKGAVAIRRFIRDITPLCLKNTP